MLIRTIVARASNFTASRPVQDDRNTGTCRGRRGRRVARVRTVDRRPVLRAVQELRGPVDIPRRRGRNRASHRSVRRRNPLRDAVHLHPVRGDRVRAVRAGIPDGHQSGVVVGDLRSARRADRGLVPQPRVPARPPSVAAQHLPRGRGDRARARPVHHLVRTNQCLPGAAGGVGPHPPGRLPPARHLQRHRSRHQAHPTVLPRQSRGDAAVAHRGHDRRRVRRDHRPRLRGRARRRLVVLDPAGHARRPRRARGRAVQPVRQRHARAVTAFLRRHRLPGPGHRRVRATDMDVAPVRRDARRRRSRPPPTSPTATGTYSSLSC